MLLPTRVSVSTSIVEETVDYRCARCGHRAVATVAGGGTGLAVSGVSLSNAQLDAQVGAAQAARLARCPRCGARDRAALARVLAVSALVGGLAGFAAWLVAADQLHRSDPSGRVAGLAGVAAFAVVKAAMTVLKLRSVDRRLRFHRVAI